MPQRFEHQRVEQESQSTAPEDFADEQGSERIRRSGAKESDDEALDAVLDDIETTLEGNAQEYVSSFVQQGGE